MQSVQKVQPRTGGHRRPLDLDHLRSQGLVPACPAVMLNRVRSRICVAHPWSWAIGSSTSAAQMSFDMVVCRRKARPFVLITKSGLQENGRPSPEGNGARARVSFNGLMNHRQRVFSKERAMRSQLTFFDLPSA